MNDNAPTHIVTLTLNPTIDRSATTPRVVPEDKLRCSEPTAEPGGGGINVARALHELGGQVTAVYTRGGLAGALLEQRLEAAGIAQRAVPIGGDTRQNLTVFEADSDRAYRFVMPGPTLSHAEADACVKVALAGKPDLVVASGSLPPGTDDDLYAEVAEAAAEHGVRLIVDTSGPALARALARGVFMIKPNHRELRELVGAEHELHDDQAIARAGRALVERGAAQVVLVSLGAGGAMLVTAELTRRLTAPTVPIRSRVGAGDCTVAGMVLGLSRGWPIERAAHLALAAGAAAVMTPGTELCHRDDVERLFRSMDTGD